MKQALLTESNVLDEIIAIYKSPKYQTNLTIYYDDNKQNYIGVGGPIPFGFGITFNTANEIEKYVKDNELVLCGEDNYYCPIDAKTIYEYLEASNKGLLEWHKPASNFHWNKNLWTSAGYNFEQPIKKDGLLSNYAKILKIIYDNQPISKRDTLIKAGYDVDRYLSRGYLSALFSGLAQTGLTQYDKKTKKLSIGPNFEEYCYDTGLIKAFPEIDVDFDIDDGNIKTIEEALILPEEDVLSEIAQIYTKYDFYTSSVTTTKRYYELAILYDMPLPDNLDHDQAYNEMYKIVDPMANEIDEYSETKDIPITYNFGVRNDNKTVVGIITVHQIHVEDDGPGDWVEMDWL